MSNGDRPITIDGIVEDLKALAQECEGSPSPVGQDAWLERAEVLINRNLDGRDFQQLTKIRDTVTSAASLMQIEPGNSRLKPVLDHIKAATDKRGN